MSTILWIIIFVLALAVLLKSAKLFVEGCEKLVKSQGWSSFFVGVTVLALGTSLPELATSIWATVSGYTSLVTSNVVGSNIANILLILGVSAVMAKRIEMSKDHVHSQIGILLGSTFLLVVSIYDGRFEWYEGLLLLVVYAVYTIYNAEEHKAGRLELLKNWLSRMNGVEAKHIFIMIGSALALGASSYFVVKAIQEISTQTQILPSVLGASLLAVGTSLPELVTTIMALKKGDNDMALGNIIGSNVINATLVIAIPSLFHSLDVTNDMLVLGIPFLLMSTLLLVFALSQRKLSSYEGGIYIMLYVAFSFQLLTSF